MVKSSALLLARRITKNIYDNKHQEYQDKLQRLNIELEEYTTADYEYQTTVATVVSVARRARAIFENSSDIAGKRTFLNYLLQNPTIKDRKLYFSIAPPFDSILELADSSNWLSTVNKFRTIKWNNLKKDYQFNNLLKCIDSFYIS
jgi:hypothetical protein